MSSQDQSGKPALAADVPESARNTVPPALEFRHVTFQYPSEDFNIINDLSFSVMEGSFHCIVGTSGCGKSTIFRLVNGLLIPKDGEILTGGVSLTMDRAGSAKGLKGQHGNGGIGRRKPVCGYMPQKDLLFPWRTVGENLALPLEISGGYKKAEIREQVDAALEDVGLTGWRDKMPDELSGGMRQRAAFARTMLTGSGLLLLDEPFSALDFLTRISMQEWLLDVWEKHRKTILFITHDVEEAVFLSQSVLAVTRTPIHTLEEAPVPAAMPRTRECLAEPDMVELKESLIRMLRNQSQK